jgi:hypothetical protein
MVILVWHGYLLAGTGSNIYTQALVREWARAGHDVTVVCQERHPEAFDLAGARIVRPELPDGLLPVFVLDRSAGLRMRRRCASSRRRISCSPTTSCSAERSARRAACVTR